ARSGGRVRQVIAAEAGRCRVETKKGKADMKRFPVPVLAYAVPTFALGYVWQLVIFERYYANLAMYRPGE
ncbi:MAG: hypothetical protein K0S21_2715, partial [Rhizobiaceae bacterium]|nr:hypothetical protein [Rhizobiaceae bacterium]